MIMSTIQHSRILTLLSRISLASAATTIIASGAVVILLMLVPTWVSWGVALGSGLITLLGLSWLLGMRLLSYAIDLSSAKLL
jgi:hypothetical protein